jgi:hypothetical protein
LKLLSRIWYFADMNVRGPRQAAGVRHQPSRAELLREVQALRSEQALLVEEVRQLLAAVAVYRDLAERALRIRPRDVALNPQFTEPATARDGAPRTGRPRAPK